MPNLLVVCTHNSARSQMAEAFFRKHGSDLFQVYSAGTIPTPIDPLTVEVMKEKGIDISQQHSKHFDQYLGHLAVHTLIVACKDKDSRCPVTWPNVFERLQWPFEDPTSSTGTHDERLKKFRAVRDEIEAKVVEWLKSKSKK